MAKKDNDITPAVLLQHIQAMEKRLVVRMEDVRVGLKADVRAVGERVVLVEKKVDLARVQIGNIDERLDDVEVVQVPMLKKAVRMR